MNEITSTSAAVSVVAFSGKETAPDGFRVVSLHYKATKGKDKDGKEVTIPAKSAVACVVPVIAVSTVSPVVLQSAVQDAINDLQDQLIRKIVDTDGKTMFSVSDVSAESVAAFALAQSNSKRLNKEVLGNWFDTALQDKLMTALVSVLGFDPATQTDQQVTKLIQTVQSYRTKVCELSAPRPDVSQTTAISLTKAVNLADDSGIKVQLLSKLEYLAKPRDAEFIGL